MTGGIEEAHVPQGLCPHSAWADGPQLVSGTEQEEPQGAANGVWHGAVHDVSQGAAVTHAVLTPVAKSDF
ncbi:MAG TPA: hypothetical protein VM452_18895 [Caulifigura sp.]|jgi:hypothetical protein|nr:hypothetical protein [Caulifigura sp.]